MIRAYPNRPSLWPGNTLTLHVSTDAPQFRVDLYRQGESLVYLTSSDWWPGQDFADGNFDQDWGWPGYDLQVPVDWPSGAYVVLLVEGDGNGNQRTNPDSSTAEGRDSRALFVVKSPAAGESTCIIYKLPLFTYQAYNYTGGGSLYVDHSGNVVSDPNIRVAMRRPGGGIGGMTSFTNYPSPGDGDVDDYDTTSLRSSFAHWDVPFIRWLQRNGYKVDYCTDLDIHDDPDFLTPYRLLLSAGHDEYWSDDLRANVEAFIGKGGNVAFFSGNVCYWHIGYDANSMTFNRDYGWWGVPVLVANPKIPRPETALTGTSYSYGGGHWYRHDSKGNQIIRPAIGYTVQHHEHWVYEKTNLQEGDVFGDYYDQGKTDPAALIGYECDGTLYDDSSGVAVPTRQAGTPSAYTPHDFTILAFAELVSFDPPWDHQLAAHGVPFNAVGVATMGVYSGNSGGVVFTAATVDWPRVLASGKEPRVEQITRNVIARLKARAIRIRGPFPMICGVSVAVAGRTANFQADTSMLPNQQNLKYRWNVYGDVTQFVGTPGPKFKVTIETAGVPVTVTVSVDDGSECPFFGTLTFIPISEQEYQQIQIWCALRDLIAKASQFRKNQEGTREGDRFFVDPLWDPLRDRPVGLMSLEGLQGILQASERLSELVRNAIDPAFSR